MNKFIKNKLSLAVLTALSGMSGAAMAQTNESTESDSELYEEVIVYGIRNALETALEEKRDAANIKEIIQAEDIGKLPDQNLAEVLENITGVQIDRANGVGTSVQIRGTGANRVEINGVSTVGANSGRSGIGFDDLPAALIGSVEVTKVPTAKTIEGSVGGTINLRTLRGLDLKEQVVSVRYQEERSDLADSTTPRLSGTFGNNWDTDTIFGEVGFVVSASYVEQHVASFDPRFDRDRELLPGSGRASEEAFPFLRTQFLDQMLSRAEYETKNVTSSFEFAPNDELKFYADVTLNDQQRVGQSNRVQFSGTGGNHVIDATTNNTFETINLGTIDGPNGPLVLGEVQAVTSGVLGVGVNGGGVIDPNMRTQTLAGSRVTESSVYALGGEWERDALKLEVELSRAESDTVRPDVNMTLDFINPRGPQPSTSGSADNGVPLIFDARGGTLQFGLAPDYRDPVTDELLTPTNQELLDPGNYAFRQLQLGNDTTYGTETAFRIDATYDLEDVPFLAAIKTGLRWNENTSKSATISNATTFASGATQVDRPRADLFSDIVVPGQNNFNAADDRTLYVRDYLVPNSTLAYRDPAAIVRSLNNAIAVNNALLVADGTWEQLWMANASLQDPDPANPGQPHPNGIFQAFPLISAPGVSQSSVFDITEETLALYLQGDYDFELGSVGIRGNLGVRYLRTDIDSIGNTVTEIDGEDTVTPTLNTSSYNKLLPRFNLVAEVTEDIFIRAGVAKDIRRPDFNDLSTSFSYPNGAQTEIQFGNPELEPEEVTSFDISAEYYFSDAGFVSVGFFHKEREDLFGKLISSPVEANVGGQIERDITDPCEEGGIFNPIAQWGVWYPGEGEGICVPFSNPINVSGDTTQTGIEMAVQYDLSDFEDTLGWASGFGVIANYTMQESDSSSDDFWDGSGDANALNDVLGRTGDGQRDPITGERVYTTPTLDDDPVVQRRILPKLSEDAYNITVFYDKYDLSVRMRYTWRSDFIEEQFVSFDLPRIIEDRGQLNASISYDINDTFTVGVDGVNLLRDDRPEWCVNEGALLCAQGLTDRRIVLGVTGNF